MAHVSVWGATFGRIVAMPVSEDSVIWAYRMLLGREPENPGVVERHAARFNNLSELRTTFMRTPEAEKSFPKPNVLPYTIPLFLLRRPELPDVPWLFAEPSLVSPVSQLCTFEQMQDPEYQELCETLGFDHTRPARKIWEFAYILAALRAKKMVMPGKKGLGFGTGHEPLPSAFAKAGVHVTATDAPAELELRGGWAVSGQWTKALEELWKPDLVEKEAFFERVQYRPADMNAIPADLRGYDFCWSACALEHLGSIRHGLDFIRNSLETLRPGGVAVHTTEFNLQSDRETVEAHNVCIPRKRDIEQIIHELAADGHQAEPLNLWPGATPVDEYIDLPPFSTPTLKLLLGGVVSTSIGITVTKG
jgi:hypothetical protein